MRLKWLGPISGIAALLVPGVAGAGPPVRCKADFSVCWDAKGGFVRPPDSPWERQRMTIVGGDRYRADDRFRRRGDDDDSWFGWLRDRDRRQRDKDD